MSDSKQGGGEPSMEEILASIRKIISEDTAEDGQKGSGSADDPAGQSTSAAQQADANGVGDDVLELSDDAAEDDAAPEGAAQDDADAQAADDAPLDLTDEIEPDTADAAPDVTAASDDDAPLELDEPVDGDADVPAAAQAHAEADNAPPADDLGDGADADEFDAMPADAGQGGDADTAPMAAAAADDDSDDETPFLGDPFDDLAAGGQAPDTAPDTAAEATLAAGAMAGAGGAAAGNRAGASRRAPDTATPLGPDDQRVISENAEQQAVEQLTSLARQAEDAPGGTAADNVDHILARMVRDALRPQLREWMDRNLPQIVERIVREEVQRMTRRAQGLDDDTRY